MKGLWMAWAVAVLAAPAGLAALEDHPLAGTAWRLVEFQSMDDADIYLRPEDPALYTMRLNPDGSVAMRLNCNRASGTWFAEAASDTSAGGRFTLGPLAVTKALCPPPSLDEHIVSRIEYIRSYYLKGGRLHLSLMADSGIYTWERDPARAAAVEDGGPRNWVVGDISGRLNLREEPSIRAGVVTRYPPGTILDNLGVREAEGRVWCDVQELGGGPRGFVAHDYLKPAVSPDGSVATGPDDSALRAGEGDYDATGYVLCAQVEGVDPTQCEFGVSRAGGGYATVVISKPGGGARVIFFRMGIPIGASTSEADGYPEFRAAKEDDVHIIRVGSERYEIPDAVVLGG